MSHIADIFREGGRILFVTPGHGDNDDAREALRHAGPFDTVVCPPSVEDLYRMPFVREPDGGRHFGLEGIRRLAGRGRDPMAGAGRRMDDNLRGVFA